MTFVGVLMVAGGALGALLIGGWTVKWVAAAFANGSVETYGAISLAPALVVSSVPVLFCLVMVYGGWMLLCGQHRLRKARPPA